MPFIIVANGRPGSGKSTFVKFLSSQLRTATEYSVQVFNDRDILLDMARTDDLREIIRALDENNFEVKDSIAYDIAIDKLIEKLREADGDQILLVEFSRNDYVRTFQRFGDMPFQDNFLVVYMDTNLELCKKRNTTREYSVPAQEMDTYFKTDDIEQLVSFYPKHVIKLNNENEIVALTQKVTEMWPVLQQKISQENN